MAVEEKDLAFMTFVILLQSIDLRGGTGKAQIWA
jgi:hypothetical protein